MSRSKSMGLTSLFISQALAALSIQVLAFSLVWKVVDWFNSPVVTTLCRTSFAITGLILMPWFGGWIDRSNRLQAAAKGDLLYVISAIFLLVILPFVAKGERSGLLLLLGFYGLCGLARAIQSAAFSAALADMAGERSRGQMFARWGSISNMIALVAPPLGGMLVGRIETTFMVVVVILCVAVALSNAFRLSYTLPAHLNGEETRKKQSTLRDLRDTWSFLQSKKLITKIIVAALILNVVEAPVISLTPILVKLDWHLGVTELALAQACFALGLLSSSLLQSFWSNFLREEWLVMISLSMLTCSLGCLGGWSGAPTIALYCGMFFYGFGTMFFNIPVKTMIANSTPKTMRGRVMSLVTVLSGASMPAGLILFGAGAQSFSVRSIVWIGVLIFSGVTFWLGLSFVRLHKAEEITRIGA